MSADTTHQFYAQNAETYAASGSPSENPRRDRFLSILHKGATILELGCGSGRDSRIMLDAGFDVTPTDGTPEMAQQAQLRLGIPVAVLRFGDLDVRDAYNGIWASACLLHVPRSELPDVLKRIHRALKPNGVFYASFKAGDGEGRDTLGRYYNYPSTKWLEKLYAGLSWLNVTIETTDGSAYDRLPTRWLHVFAYKS